MRPPSSLLGVLLLFFEGHLCDLTLWPAGSVSVEVLVGTNVTLAVSHAGASQPEVMWFLEKLLVAKWTVGEHSFLDPSGVLKAEQNGSLTFTNVTMSCNGTYTVEMNQIGEATVTSTFHLFVYDMIVNVSLQADSKDAMEGDVNFTLYYSTIQGEAKEVQWFFNGIHIKEDKSHYSIHGKRLIIKHPSRNHTGLYTVSLTNPFSSEAQHRNITVLYGPDRPVLKVTPTKAFFVSGESLFLSCQADGEPAPSVAWFFNGEFIPASSAGTLALTDVNTNQSGSYTCLMINTRTNSTLERNITVTVYESPGGAPRCSVQAAFGGTALQFLCVWPGGEPASRLSFPDLSADAGDGHYSITVRDIHRLNRQEIVCTAQHPLIRTRCTVFPCAPVDFPAVVLSSMSPDEQMTVTVDCSPESTPEALVLWMKDGEILQNDHKYRISANTTRLIISDFNATSADLDTYTCTAINPLGNKTLDTTLTGPQMSNSSVLLSDDGTEVIVMWDVPLASVITGFDIQMKGPSEPGLNAADFRTIQKLPAFTRSTGISALNPKSTYYFRIIPKAGRTAGEQSKTHRIGPAAGLDSAAVSALSAGIPCSFLLVIIVIGFIYCGTRDRSPRYPVGKVVVSQSTINPHNLLRARLKTPAEFRLQQPERLDPVSSVDSRVRIATTV